MTWNEVKQLLGEDFGCFIIFLSRRQAEDIEEGLKLSLKGAQFLKSSTLERIRSDLACGILQETFGSRLCQADTSISRSEFEQAEQEMTQWVEERDSHDVQSYFEYLCSWDLKGEDWISRRPQSFDEFISSGLAA